MNSIICFTSDFGSGDTWVGMCHAVILRACPQVRIVDLAHDVPPFDIRKAAVVAASGVWQLPDAIHLAVVDPGVGGGRRDLIVVTGSGSILVGPDNGVLIPATWRSGGIAEVFSIVPEHLDFSLPLPTFHARDILAPAAAILACGVQASVIGEPVDPDTMAGPPFAPHRVEGDALVAEVIDIDRFGSFRIAIPAEALHDRVGRGERVEITIGHLLVEAPFGLTFSDVEEGEPVVLIDSSGWLTVAVNLGSAADRYGVEPGVVAHCHLPGR
ncbi:SAM hydrolase/SAM-dependent halogenase family protein [Anaerosoma tenue]|uniref:SAM hydrolase/SAM-dependent halogenase family protein n=1 Tax=Anaerosoma tenue TaxID=2933588 RepID=UPI002260CB94|nr:SAM-dependent chlorinase/fluorinase [Anaerosoma tenue]MCK8115681.1 SAM-dependent chlorinase/fluorinase [Anaerosoma tenue]